MNAERVIDRAVRFYGLPRDTLLGKSRQRHIVRPRHAVMAALRNHGLSFTAIARLTNRADHGTVIHAVRVAEVLAERQPLFAAAVSAITGAVAPSDAYPRRARALAMIRAGERTATIAAACGRSTYWVRRLRLAHGLPCPPIRPLTWLDCPPHLIERFRELRHHLGAAEARAILEREAGA